MHVRGDDPIGLARGRLAHAECSLIHWLMTGTDEPIDGLRLRIPAEPDATEADQRRRELLEDLLSAEV